MGLSTTQAVYGSPGRTRTADLMINSHPLYRLSYRGIRPNLKSNLYVGQGVFSEISSSILRGYEIISFDQPYFMVFLVIILALNKLSFLYLADAKTLFFLRF